MGMVQQRLSGVRPPPRQARPFHDLLAGRARTAGMVLDHLDQHWVQPRDRQVGSKGEW